MKQGMKTFLHVLTGMVIGGSASCAATYIFTKKKFMKISDDRVKSLEEYIERLQMEKISATLGYSGAGSGDGVDAIDSAEDGNDISETSGYNDDPRLKDYQEVKEDGTVYTRYSKISSGYGKSAVDAKYEQIAAEMEHRMENPDGEEEEDMRTEAEIEYELANKGMEEASNLANRNSSPKIIEYDDYGKTGYLDEVDLYYYTGDDVLVDDENQIVASPEELLGDCLEASGFKTNREKELYVRNYRRSTDYAVTKYFSSFSEKDIY